jgi:hypothetical protein
MNELVNNPYRIKLCRLHDIDRPSATRSLANHGQKFNTAVNIHCNWTASNKIQMFVFQFRMLVLM